jgi:hypothetical protein
MSIGFSEYTCENPTLLEVTYRQLVPKLTIYICHQLCHASINLSNLHSRKNGDQSHTNPKVL